MQEKEHKETKSWSQDTVITELVDLTVRCLAACPHEIFAFLKKESVKIFTIVCSPRKWQIKSRVSISVVKKIGTAKNRSLSSMKSRGSSLYD